MTVKTTNEQTEAVTVEDDLVEEQPSLNQDKLAALKAKMAQKQEESVPPKIVAPRRRSVRIGVIGGGQAGSNLCAEFHAQGYSAVALNTAPQDLEYVNLPEDCKLLLDYGMGGASKERQIGLDAAEMHKDAIRALVHDKLGDAQVHLFCTSLGGGTGSGSIPTVIDVLAETGKPLVMVTVLPMSADDSQTKRNALEALKELSNEVKNKRVHNLIVVDNAKIENIYSEVSQLDFFKVANQAVVAPLEAFNFLSSQPSPVKALDPMEFTKILVDGGGLSVYGELEVTDYEDETAIASAVIENLNSGLLASGFDLKDSKYVGVMIVANKKVWDKIPSSSVEYAMSLIEEVCGTPDSIFKGIYASEDVPSGMVKVYSMFSGLGLPSTRVEQLKKDAAAFEEKAKQKTTERNLHLTLDTGEEEQVSTAEKARKLISKKKSAFGSLLNSSVQDRRKK